jgi:hypothetical protein
MGLTPEKNVSLIMRSIDMLSSAVWLGLLQATSRTVTRGLSEIMKGYIVSSKIDGR